MATDVTGIGYEGLDAEALLSRLRLRGITTVVDVRLNPISRKRGLSKRALQERLAADGIRYEHIPALGNPRDNRDGFADTSGAAGREARTRFEGLLSGTAAQAGLDQVVALAQEGSVALLCFEEDENACHRQLVLAELQRRELAEV